MSSRSLVRAGVQLSAVRCDNFLPAFAVNTLAAIAKCQHTGETPLLVQKICFGL